MILTLVVYIKICLSVSKNGNSVCFMNNLLAAQRRFGKVLSLSVW